MEFRVTTVHPLLDKLQRANHEWEFCRYATYLRVELWNLNGLKLVRKDRKSKWLTRTKGSTKQQITPLFTCYTNISHCQNTCHFIACYRAPLPSCVSPPGGKACVNICIPSRSKSLRLLAMCFFTCKHLNVCANRADGQTVGCPTALRVLLHAKRSCSAGQSSRCWSPSTSKVCLPHHSLIHWADHCQLGPKQRRLRRDQCGVVCNPTAWYASLQEVLWRFSIALP